MGDGVAEQESLLVEAQRALELADSDPRSALIAADDVLARIPRQREPEAVATAQRAAALALREMGGDLTQAERRLRSAIRRTEVSAPRAAAEARMSLALVLLEEGRTRAALNAADRASVALDGVGAARLLAQRALVLQRCGRTDEALLAFESALPILRSAQDTRWEARLLNNRGLLYAYRGKLSAAQQDLQRARALWDELNEHKKVTYAVWNLGFVAALRGDVVGALEAYDAAERSFEAASLPYASLLLDKSHALLSCGLSDEAAEAAEHAVEVLRSGGAGANAGEGLLVAAQANIARGSPDRAFEQADEAVRLLTAQGRPGWALRARCFRLQAIATREPTAATVKEALRLRRQLGDAHWRAEELDVSLLAARVATELHDYRTATQQLEHARRARARGPLGLRVRGWYAEALLRHQTGRRSSARRAIDAGLAAIHREQQTLGASDLRAHLSSLGQDLAALGLDIALERGPASAVLSAAEQHRATSLGLAPVRPPDDESLAQLMAELRLLMAEENNHQLAGGVLSRATMTRRLELEDRIRSMHRLSRGDPERSSQGRDQLVHELTAQLDTRAFVEIFTHRDQLHAVTVVDGVARHHVLGTLTAIRIEVESLRFAMTRAAAGSTTSSILDGWQRSASRLQALTLDAMREIDGRELVLSPSARLHATPWNALQHSGDVAISVVPSAASWLAARRAPEFGSVDPLLVAGPDLPGADAEVALLATELQPRQRVLRGADATSSRVLDALPSAPIAHIAAHGLLRTDNAMFSALRLADGPLTVYDLERLPSVPSLVVLPACRSAAGLARAGEETLGLSYALLALGARAVIASVLPISDAATLPLMRKFYAALSEGMSPAHALAAAVSSADDVSASAFICLGAG